MLEMTMSMSEVVDMILDRAWEVEDVFEVEELPALVTEPYGDDEEDEALIYAVCQRMLEDCGFFSGQEFSLAQVGQAIEAGLFDSYTFEDFT